MKKQTSKSKKAVEAKKLKKELALKLQTVFSETVSGYGKAKKATAIIENFAKKLAKKVALKRVKLTESLVEDLKSETTETKKLSKAKANPAKK
ncbi:hypothetical protein ABIB40_001948 [Pedobacter sp. UYP30]|uniref:hypothetical protein n=1 Tax=Pedobacter sp. UYP30 TaxID=1756400 RepID=UPI003391AD11